jgi:hypothetical protein
MSKGAGQLYKQLAYDTFEPQLIRDPEDDDLMLEVCQKEIKAAGFPLPDDDDIWLEYVYAAQEMVAIQQDGFVYRKERREDGSTDHVLYTIHNHPAFKDMT